MVFFILFFKNLFQFFPSTFDLIGIEFGVFFLHFFYLLISFSFNFCLLSNKMVFMDIVGQILIYNCIQPNFWYFTKYKSDPLIFFNLNGFDISSWIKLFMDITEICELGILILLYFNNPKNISGCNHWN
jgi:hypothetical protein